MSMKYSVSSFRKWACRRKDIDDPVEKFEAMVLSPKQPTSAATRRLAG